MTTLHPFERAGLGKAPFSCTGVSVNWFCPPGFPEARKPGGSCNYCGTGILYEYAIESADGRRFVVGSDCVRRTSAVVIGFRDARLKLAREQRAEKVTARRVQNAQARAERQLQRQAEAASRRAEYKAACPELVAFIERHAAPEGSPGRNEFLADMAASLEGWGYLSEKQAAAVQRMMDREAQQDRDRKYSQHFGTVGKPITVEVQVLKVLTFYGSYMGRATTTNLHIMRTTDGNAAIYKGSAVLGARGAKLRATFTVKEHGTREGVRQTVLARPRKVENLTPGNGTPAAGGDEDEPTDHAYNAADRTERYGARDL